MKDINNVFFVKTKNLDNEFINIIDKFDLTLQIILIKIFRNNFKNDEYNLIYILKDL